MPVGIFCRFYPTANLPPGQPKQRHRQTHGVSHGAHHNLISLISLISLMQAPHPRNTHTAVAIKQAKHYPCGNFSPEPNHTAAGKPSGDHMTPSFCQTSQTGQTSQTQASRQRRQHTADAIKNLKLLRKFLKSIQKRHWHLLRKRELFRRYGIFRQNRAEEFRVRLWR